MTDEKEDSKDWLNELCRMLHPTTRLDVRLTASSNVMMLTGSDEGRLFIRQNKPLLEALFQTLNDPNVLIQKDAIHSLVNLSSDDVFNHITLQQYNIIPTLIRCITVARSPFADKAASILSNMTRNETAAKAVFDKIEKQLDLLLGIYTKIGYNSEKQHMDYLGQVFANMTQCKQGRTFILDRDHLRIQKLIPFINHESITRRGSTCIMLKNICFDSAVNSWLLGPSVDLLPTLLKPLCGAEIANLDEDDMDKLPVDLQYLDEDTKMEEDGDIRLMLVETLMLLCNRKQDRIFVRDSSTYIVLRELHKVEMAVAKESEINRIIQQVIDIMISDDAGVEDIRADVDIPDEVQTKLNEQTEVEKKDIERYERELNSNFTNCVKRFINCMATTTNGATSTKTGTTAPAPAGTASAASTTKTGTKSATCCRCLRWYKRDKLTGDQFCARCVGDGSLRGAKCRWCRGNLTHKEGTNEPIKATCDNCTKLQIRYGPPQHCKLCKLEAAFKTKRGSMVCRRCDYCQQNYGKPQKCEKCGVLAAWEGDKIEKINNMRLCFICSFREKRKLNTGSKQNKPDKGGSDGSKELDKENKTKKKEPDKEKKKPEEKKVQSKEDKQLEAFVTIKSTEAVEDIDYDQHTSASLATNQLHLKLKEMNAELVKRRAIIEDKDVTIAKLRGLVTSKMHNHENDRRNWEARLQSRISDFKEQIQKLTSELQSLKAEKKIEKKKKKEKRNKKKGNTLLQNRPEAVKQELFSNTLKRPSQTTSKDDEQPYYKKKEKLIESEKSAIKRKSSEEKEELLPEPKKKRMLESDEEEEEVEKVEKEDEKAKIESDSDSDDVEAALKEIDEEEKGLINGEEMDDSNDSKSKPATIEEQNKEIKEFSSSSDSEQQVQEKPNSPNSQNQAATPPANANTPATTSPSQQDKQQQQRRQKPADFSSSESEDEDERKKSSLQHSDEHHQHHDTPTKQDDEKSDELMPEIKSDLLEDLRDSE